MQLQYKGFLIKGFKTFLEMGMKYAVHKVELSNEAQFKLAVIGYYLDKSSLKSKNGKPSIENTGARFGLHRNTISNRLKQFDKYNLKKLEPKSTAPKNTKSRNKINLNVEQKIFEIRDKCPYLGKEKIEEILKRDYGLICSASTIGRRLKYHKRQYEWRRYESACKFKKTIKKRKGNKQRLPKIRAKRVGEIIQIDTIRIMYKGGNIYVINAIDVYSKLAISYAYKNPNSANARDFLNNKVIELFGYKNINSNINLVAKIEFIQTDNGSEFHKYFDKACKELKIKHVWTYPNCPKMNGCIERFNSTIQIECLEKKDAIRDINVVNKRIYDYLINYNTYRPHQSLNYLTPMEVFIQFQLQQINPDFLNHSMHKRLGTSTNYLLQVDFNFENSIIL